jgi:hypothetical protein
MFPWENRPWLLLSQKSGLNEAASGKAGRRGSRRTAPQPSLFREPLVRQDSPRLRESIKAARRRQLYRQSDIRYE